MWARLTSRAGTSVSANATPHSRASWGRGSGVISTRLALVWPPQGEVPSPRPPPPPPRSCLQFCSLLISSRASSLVRVIFSCLQDEGRRDWLCLTSRCEQRTLVGSPCPFLPLPLLLPLGRSHWLALVM